MSMMRATILYCVGDTVSWPERYQEHRIRIRKQIYGMITSFKDFYIPCVLCSASMDIYQEETEESLSMMRMMGVKSGDRHLCTNFLLLSDSPLCGSIRTSARPMCQQCSIDSVANCYIRMRYRKESMSVGGYLMQDIHMIPKLKSVSV